MRDNACTGENGEHRYFSNFDLIALANGLLLQLKVEEAFEEIGEVVEGVPTAREV